MSRLAAVALIVMLLLQPAFAQGDVMGPALQAIQAKQFSTAVKLLEPLAEQGNHDAQYNLGMLYLWGQGVAKNEKKAFDFFTRAADQNDPRAQLQLGTLYTMGWGTAVDEQKARSLIGKAAEQRYPPAEYQMSTIERAFHWTRRACEDGYNPGCYMLALMYQNGWDTSPDPVEATHWYYESLITTRDLDALLGIGSLAAAGRLAGVDAAASTEIAYAALSLINHFKGHLVPSAQAEPGKQLAALKARLTPAELAAAKARYARATAGGVDRWASPNGCVLVDMLMANPDKPSSIIDDCTRLAAIGVPVAEYNLGWMTMTGYLMPQDSAAALKWLRSAADADFAAAELVLGKELATGERLPRDQVGALGWLLVAEPRLKSGDLIDKYHQDAVNGINALGFQLTPTQASQARDWAAAWDKAHPMRHRPEVRDLSEDGIALSDQNDLKGAIEKFDAAIKADSHFAEPLFYRGRAMLQLKQTGQARTDIEAGLAIEPGNKIGRVSLGDVKAAAGDNAGAVAEFSAVLAEDPHFVYALAKRGDAYAALDDYASSAKDIALVIKLVPSSAKVNGPILAGHLYLSGQYEAAAAQYHAMAADPKTFGAPSFMLNEYLATAHAGKDGSAQLARDEARLVDHKWPYPIFGFLLGRLPPLALLGTAADEWQKCEARYYIAEKNALDGKVDKANDQFKAIAKACPYPIESSWRSEYYARRLESQQ